MPIMVYALTSATWTIAAIATLSNVRPHVLRCLQESTCPLNNTLGGDRGSDHLLPLGLIIPNIAALATLATRAFTYLELDDFRGLPTSEHKVVMPFNATWRV